MPSAERSGLIGTDRPLGDRAGAARWRSPRKAGCVFARISRHSALEASLPAWIAHMLQTHGLAARALRASRSPNRSRASNPADILRLATALKAAGVRFALEHYGTGIDPLAMLGTLPLDFVKIDGSLMQGLTTDKLLQSKVGSLIEAARERGIETIAERVEDANTLAVLWQLGVQHVQGSCSRPPKKSRFPEPARRAGGCPLVLRACRARRSHGRGTARLHPRLAANGSIRLHSGTSKESLMRKSRLFAALVLGGLLGTGLVACEQKGPAEKAGEKIDDAAKDVKRRRREGRRQDRGRRRGREGQGRRASSPAPGRQTTSRPSTLR